MSHEDGLPFNMIRSMCSLRSAVGRNMCSITLQENVPAEILPGEGQTTTKSRPYQESVLPPPTSLPIPSAATSMVSATTAVRP